ncbi:MAG: hypothetical protein IB618_02765 [Candidatus Pacearchaeota archaeon]|nr:MAG: hypothetical protein IB618_02765 [Candidatus Pacearchaeota archaeon]
MVFNFLKRKKEKKEITFPELEKWLDEDGNVIDILNKFKQKTETYFEQINEALNRIKENLIALKSVKLTDRKVNERIKLMVLQNRDVYVKYLEKLIAAIEKQTEKSNSLKEIEDFVVFTSTQLDNFSKQSFRNFHIMTELIGKESEIIVRDIKKINNVINKLQKIDKKEIKVIEDIKENIKDINRKKERNQSLIINLEKNQKKIADINDKIKDAEKKNEKIKKSDDWKKREMLAEKVSLLKKELAKNDVEAKALFLSIEKAIKKYAWKEKDKKLLDYIKNPIARLKEDKELKIVRTLEEIETDIKEGSIKLDKRTESRILKNIKVLSKEKLNEFLNKKEELKQNIQKFSVEVDSIKIVFISLTELNNKKDEITQEILKLEKMKKDFEQEIINRKNEIKVIIETIGGNLK